MCIHETYEFTEAWCKYPIFAIVHAMVIINTCFTSSYMYIYIYTIHAHYMCIYLRMFYYPNMVTKGKMAIGDCS